MFSKLKGSNSCSPTPSEKMLPATPIDTNPISEIFEVGKQVASAGPELAWKIYDAVRKCDEKEASVFFFDKRWADRLLSGSKRREVIVDVLRRGVTQLENLQHQRILTVIQSLVETNDTMAFATEPVLGSLANILGCLEDRLRQGVPSFLREYTFSEFEHTYGLLQMTEALGYLHFSARVIHRGICPQSVIINKRGTWKLAGLEFSEKANEGDLMLPVASHPYTSKLPKMCQPDLDFVAPEIQSSSACSPQSDMFSLGLLICAIYNNGRSPIESNFSSASYFKQLETLSITASEIMERMPALLKDSVSSMLEAAARKRPTSQNFATSRYFMDPGVHSLQYMDAISGKDLGYRINFYENLRDILNLIPKKMWFQHLIPSMEKEVMEHGTEGLACLLECVLIMAAECTRDEYQSHLIPFLRTIFSLNRSIQATAVLLENVDILIDKTAKSDLQADILPLIISSFQTNCPQVQCAALKVISKVMDDLDDETIKDTILPKVRIVFTKESDTQMQENALACIIRVLNLLDRSKIECDILPILLQANLSEPSIMMPTAKIYKHLMSEKILQGDYHSELIATKIMPSFFPVIVDSALQFDDFLFVSELLQEMFDMVTKYQRFKLKQEDLPSMDKLPVQFKMALEAPSPTCPFAGEEVISSSLSPSPSPFQFNVEAPSRRQSVCSEFVSNIMRATSPDTSPDEDDADANPFLRVNNESTLKQRRHSDNSIQIPSGLNSATSSSNLNKNNASSTLNPLNRARSSSSLAYSSNRRRHSSVNPHDLQRFATKLMDSAAESMVESVEKASKATSAGMHLGLDSITSVKGLNPLPSPSRRGSRRCSVVDIISSPSCLTTTSKTSTKPSPKPSKKIFNKIGSEMQNLLKK